MHDAPNLPISHCSTADNSRNCQCSSHLSSGDFQKLTACDSLLRGFAERRKRDDKSSENAVLWMVSGTPAAMTRINTGCDHLPPNADIPRHRALAAIAHPLQAAR